MELGRAVQMITGYSTFHVLSVAMASHSVCRTLSASWNYCLDQGLSAEQDAGSAPKAQGSQKRFGTNPWDSFSRVHRRNGPST